MKTKEDFQGEIRYAIRLTQRTARLYRRVQAFGMYAALVGGAAAVGAIADWFPGWLVAIGAAVVALGSAALVVIRPGDKAAQNEADLRKYEKLMAKSAKLTDAELAEALEDARQGDAPEIEPLRDVAYNDVALERNRPDAVVPLKLRQRLLAALA